MKPTTGAVAIALLGALGFALHFAIADASRPDAAAAMAPATAGSQVLLQEQAAHGSAQAQYRLGQMAELGQGLPAPDPRAAIDWYRKAAAQEYGPAEFALGNLSLHGKGVPQDYGAAEYWLERGAHEGDDGAQVALGKMFEEGLGQAPDPVMAYVWYDLAAEQGNGVARHSRDRLAKSMSREDLNEAQRIVPSISRYVSGAEVPKS